MNLSIIILTYNEEKNIEACLDSVANLNVPIFVVDSFSTDKTIEIVEKRGLKYRQHPFENYAAQRNWAQFNNPFKSEWVLHLDAGERLTDALQNWINKNFSTETDIDGYMFSRRTEFMGKWIKYGGHYPNYHLRLFKTTKGHCENKIYDQHFIVVGKKERLNAGLDIVDTVMDNLKDFSIGHAKWAVFEAIEIIQSQIDTGEVKTKLFGNPIERRRWLKNNIFQKTPLFLRSILYFLYRYFVRLGFLDGRRGLIFHFLQGFWFRFLIDSNIVFIKQKINEGESLKQIAKDLEVEKILRG